MIRAHHLRSVPSPASILMCKGVSNTLVRSSWPEFGQIFSSLLFALSPGHLDIHRYVKLRLGISIMRADWARAGGPVRNWGSDPRRRRCNGA
jgi:hypothetical protein